MKLPVKKIDKLILEFNTSKIDLQEEDAKNYIVSLQDVTEKVLIEESISESEKRFKSLVQHGADLTAIVNSDGTYLYISPNYPLILGLTEDELLGKNAFDFFHPDDLEKIKAEFSKLETEKRIKTSVYRFKNKMRGWSWIQSTGTNLLDDESIKGIVVNSIEVTDLIETQQALNKSNERFEMLMQAGSESIWDYDLKKKEIFLGNGFYENFGIQTKSPKQNNSLINSLIHPKDKMRMIRSFRKTLKESSKLEWIYQYRLLKSNGEFAHVKDKAVILRDADGEAYRVVGAIKDITSEYFYEELEKIEKEVMEFSMSNQVKLKQVLELYIKKLENLFPDMQASILEVKNSKIYNIASPSLPETYIEAINGATIGNNVGSCGTAAYVKERVVVADIANDVRWSDFKDLAQKYGFKACWSQPIFNKDNDVVATFANYYSTLRVPSTFEEQAFERSQRLLSILIEKYEYLKNIQKSNERYELINKASRDAIYEWDIQNNIFYWSESFKTVFGHNVKEGSFTLQSWASLMHPEDDIKIKTLWQQFLDNPMSYFWIKEFRFRRADETYAYVEENAHIIRDKLGKPIRMVGVLRDITQVKLQTIQTELLSDISKLFKENKNLKSILYDVLEYITNLDSFALAEIWLTSSKKEELHLVSKYTKNDLIERFYEKSSHITTLKIGEGIPGKTIQKNAPQIWDEIQNTNAFIRHQAAKKTGLTAAIGLPIYHNDEPIGVLVLMSTLSAFQIKNNLDKFSKLQNYLGAEIKRKQKEEEMILLFESAPEILAIASPNGCFIKVNPAFCHLLGRTEEEILNKPFKTFLHPNDVNVTLDEYDETITGKRRATNFINRYLTKHGTYRWISWSSSDVFDEEGNVFAYGRDVTELIELQNLLENASKLAKVGGWGIDVITNKLYWSPMTRIIHEVPEDYEPSIEKAISFYDEDLRTEFTNKLKNITEKAQSYDFETIITTYKGNRKWIRIIGNTEFVNGKCIRLFGSFQDITKLKLAEIENQRIFEERNNILESIGDAFFALDVNWNVTYWNKQAEIVLNKKKEDIIGKNIWEEFKEAVNLKFYSEYQKAMKTQQTVIFDEYNPVNNLWFEVSAYPSKDGLSVYFKDVSIKKIAEKQIQETNERFEMVTEATNDAIWDYNMENNKLFWGKGFATLFHYDLTNFEPTFEFLLDCIHPEDRPNVLSKIQAFLTDDSKSNWFEEYRFLRANGTYAYVIDRAIFVRNKKGKAIRAIGAMTDITYRKEFEDSLTKLNKKLKKQTEELAFSNKELEQFAYIASHDLQEPLRMITSFLSQLEKKYHNQLDEKATLYINYAVDGAKRMRQIILDILEFSRIGKNDESKDDVDLNGVVNEVISNYSTIIDEKKAKILTANLPIIYGHKTPFKQLFQNLIGNALKYSKVNEPPVIQINVKELNDSWEFSVQDNGIGIDSEYYDKIFEIFQRLHVKENYTGTGIGLSIVKKILDNMGGKIWVISQEGKGSTFFFKIPKNETNEY